MKTPFASDTYRLTSPFGQRTLNGVAAMHGGVDLVSLSSWDIVAVAPGEVVVSHKINDKANRAWEWGNYVCVYGTDKRFYYYCHMASRAVKVGQTVKEGDKIGVMGNTGYSFGAHLHFEVREANGTVKVNAAEVLEIPNTEGVYKIDGFEKALDTLVSAGLINTPEYWRVHKADIMYLDKLIINIAEKLPSGARFTAKKTILTTDAINHLHKKGVINTPEYWHLNVGRVGYLDILIQRAALMLGT